MSPEGFMDAEGWFKCAPQICKRCGALVDWHFTDTHALWHADHGDWMAA
jgi:hypothetical protein